MNLYLIGYRGSGKSTVAPLVAEQLGWTSIDSDEQVQLLVGETIAEIFERSGEGAFRQWEASVIEGLSRQNDQVISLGGGAVLDALTRRRLAESGKSVWLTADATTLFDRINGDDQSSDTRPSLTELSGLAEVESLLKVRAPTYEETADFTVNVAGQTPQQIAEAICQWFDPV